ncbi:MAG: ABC transporter ATP-binding protein [Nitrospirota bacterium]
MKLDLGPFAALVRPHRGAMAQASLLVMGVAALNLALLWLFRYFFDHVLVRHDTAALGRIIWASLGLFALHSALSLRQHVVLARVGQRIVTALRLRLVEHLTTLSLDFFVKRRTGELMSRVTSDVGTVQQVATNVPVDLAKQSVTFVGALGLLLYMNWRLCLAVLAVIPLVVVVARLFGRRLKALSTESQDRAAESATILEEMLSGITLVKSFVMERHEVDRLGAQLERADAVAARRAALVGVFVPVVTVLTLLGALGVLWYGGVQVIAGAMSPGDLVAFLLYGGILMGPFSAAARVFSQIKEAQGAMQRVTEILNEQPMVRDAPGAARLGAVNGRVEVCDVSFAYEPGRSVLRGVSLTAEPGQIVALVGPSGGGKSTLVHLLHRFYDPLEGAILLDGRDLRAIRMADLYARIAFVPQETMLFGGTVEENIRFGRPSARQDEVAAAAEAAHAHGFIQALPNGYGTVVGEKGVRLSGGQRQRIAIARAVLKDPRILLLDEATSALDNESEVLVQDALDRLMKGRTTIVVAHRLSTIQRADHILVLDQGRIVERGTHGELLASRGVYHRLSVAVSTSAGA